MEDGRNADPNRRVLELEEVVVFSNKYSTLKRNFPTARNLRHAMCMNGKGTNTTQSRAGTIALVCPPSPHAYQRAS